MAPGLVLHTPTLAPLLPVSANEQANVHQADYSYRSLLPQKHSTATTD